MADQKISELTNITGANLADADEFVVVDVSADQTKAVTRAEFFKNTPNITVDGIISTTNGTDINMDTTASGQLKLDGNGYGGAIALNAQGMNIYTNSGARDVIFGTNETERMRIDGSGKLGIGETNPDMKLHIKDASNAYVKLEDSGGVLGGAMSAAVRLYAGANAHGQMGFISTNSGIMRLSNLQGSLYLDADSNDAHTSSIMRFAVDNSEAMRINASGRVGIGTISPSASLHVNSGIFNLNAIFESSDAGATITLIDNSTTGGSAAEHGFNTVGDQLEIRAVDNLSFETGGAGAERMRIDGSGHAIIPAGVTLGTAAGVYAAANTLDDYEEGTWTPGISDGTNAGTTNVSVGSYTKTGNHVHVQGRVRLSSLGSISSFIRITGLPFSSQAVSNNFSAMTIGRAAGLNITAGTTVCGDLRVNVSHVLLEVWDAGAGVTAMQGTEFSANGDISFSMDYLSN